MSASAEDPDGIEGVQPEWAAEGRASSDPRRRRRILWIVLSCAAVLVAIGSVALAQTLAAHAYDDADAAWLASSERLERAQQQSDDENGTVRAQVGEAAQIAKLAPAGSADAKALQSLSAAATATDAALVPSEQAAAAPGPVLDESKPFWLWELIRARERVEQATADNRALIERLHGTREKAMDARRDLLDAATAVFASVKPAAKSVENANVSATTGTVVTLRATAASVSPLTNLSPTALDRFTAYATAVADVQKSARAELAEKKGPLYRQRLAAEAFARSLAGGVLLDFNWKQTVLGYGWPGSMAGVTSWNAADGGTATILLSNSVAREWPDAASKALIAHEVGHAISAKCTDMFNWKSRSANEKWATAWAIGHGFTSDANGVQAYGYPPKSLIAKSKGCR